MILDSYIYDQAAREWEEEPEDEVIVGGDIGQDDEFDDGLDGSR